VAAWFEMIAAPGTTKRWRGRYRTAGGEWQWVESVNSNYLDDPNHPVVLSVMSRIAVAEMSVEEELRARRQIISRLADVLAVGIFQIDTSLHITFTNDRLHNILGVLPPAMPSASSTSSSTRTGYCSIQRCRRFSTMSRSTTSSCGSGFRCRIRISPHPGVPNQPAAPHRQGRLGNRRHWLPQRHHCQRGVATRTGDPRRRRRSYRLPSTGPPHSSFSISRCASPPPRSPGWP